MALWTHDMLLHQCESMSLEKDPGLAHAAWSYFSNIISHKRRAFHVSLIIINILFKHRWRCVPSLVQQHFSLSLYILSKLSRSPQISISYSMPTRLCSSMPVKHVWQVTMLMSLAPRPLDYCTAIHTPISAAATWAISAPVNAINRSWAIEAVLPKIVVLQLSTTVLSTVHTSRRLLSTMKLFICTTWPVCKMRE